MTSKYCSNCKRWLQSPESFHKDRARYDGLAVYCRECHNRVVSEEAQRFRNQAIDKLGGRCLYCGFDADHRALAFDHINGDGYLERKQGTRKLLKQIINEERDDIQLLCCNCNQIKRVENEERGLYKSVGVIVDEEHDPAPPPVTRWRKMEDGRWASKFECCISCGTTERKHAGLGLCKRCHAREFARKRAANN